MVESSEVILALQRCGKGKLEYSYTLKNQESLQNKIVILDSCNSLPPMSPAIRDYLVSKEVSSLQSTESEDVDYVPNEPPTYKLSLEIPSEDLSVVDEIHEELEDCEMSLDDQLLKETDAAIAHRRKMFNLEQQAIRQRIRETAEQEQFETCKKLIQEQERARLEEMYRLLAVEEWKRRTLEEYRAEEEKAEARLIDGEKQTKRIIMLKEERRKKLCKQYRVECEKIARELESCVQSCQYPQYLPPDVMSKHRIATQNNNTILQALVSLEQSSEQHQIDDLRESVSNLKSFLEEIKMALHVANLYGAEQAAKQQELNLQLEAEKKAELEEKKRKELMINEKQKAAEQKLAVIRSKKNSESDLGMPKTVVSLYGSLQDMLQKTSSSTSGFSGSKDPSIKKYRFDLQKAVNVTINSISANSGEGLIEKINRLQCLLGGKSIDVMGKTVNTTQHSEARLYCCNLLGKKLVKQGEDQVSSNSEAAFPIAAVAIGLWSKFPEIGDFILAHFHSVCPILVPMYVQRSNDMTDADYMRLQGYKISSSGVIETEDRFLSRMGGIVRLYAAIVASPQLPLEHSCPHPHGLEHGWTWLTRVLNMQPHPTLTAAALGDFLEVAGHALMKRFGKQFRKLLYVLWKEFIPKMEKCTPSSQRGPIARLTQFLEACISSGTFPQPKGYLHTEFWRTRSTGIAFA